MTLHDPRLACWRTEDNLDLDPREILWAEDGLELSGGGPPGGGTGEVDGYLPAGPPILVPAGTVGEDPRLVLAGFTTRVLAVSEGQVVEVEVRLNRRPGVSMLLPLSIGVTGTTAATTDYAVSRTQLEFGPLQTSAVFLVSALNAGGSESAEYLVIELDPSLAVIPNQPDVNPVVVGVDNTLWPFSSCIVTITDAPGAGTPVWDFLDFPVGGGTLELPENVGTVDGIIRLDRPATSTITFRVRSQQSGSGPHATPGTGEAGVGADFLAFDREVVVPIGATIGRFPITIYDDADTEVGPNEAFDVVGSVVSGTATAGSLTTLRVEIVDNDTSVPDPKVSWTSAFRTTEENNLNIVCIALLDLPFAFQTDIPVSVSGTASASDYSIDWGSNPVGFLRFDPNTVQASLLVRANADLETDPNEQVVLTLANGATWDLGANPSLTIQILEASSEQTALNVVRGTGAARNMIEGLVAVSPPSATLPSYAIEGESCQVVGMKRNALGQWISAWIAGMTSGDTQSLADASGAITVDVGTGATPAESGAYPTLDLSAMMFKLRAANVATEFERLVTDTNITDTEWTGPSSSAVHRSYDADLFKESHYVLWLKDPADATADTAGPAADKRCAIADVWLKYRADVDVVEVSGLLRNAAWLKTADPETTPAAVDGELNFLEFTATGVPTGWAATFMRAHPLESFSGSTVTVFANRSADYHMQTAAQRAFRFALYKTSTTSEAQAQAVLRYVNHFDAVGTLGATRAHIFGEADDVVIDHARAGFSHWNLSGAARLGWRGVVNGGAQRRDAVVTGWEAGDPVYRVLSKRYGAFVTGSEPTVGGDSGGAGIDGMSALMPSPGWRETVMMGLMGSLNRTRLSHVDVLTGENCFGHVMAEQNGGKLPFCFGLSRVGTYRHPHFNEAYLAASEYYNNTNPVFRLAPVETRARFTLEASIAAVMAVNNTLTIDDQIATPTVFTWKDTLSGASHPQYWYVHVVSDYDIEILRPSPATAGQSFAQDAMARLRGAIDAAPDLRVIGDYQGGSSIRILSDGIGAAGNAVTIAQTGTFWAAVGTLSGGADGPRPWNQPETTRDPGYKQIRAYETYDMAHASRIMNYVRDGWWLMRSPLAYAHLEEWTAYATRVWSIYDLDGPLIDAAPRNATMLGHWLLGTSTTPPLSPTLRNRGYWIVGGSTSVPSNDIRWQQLGNPRGLAWAMHIFAAFYGIAPFSMRVKLDNIVNGTASWPRMVAQFVDYVATEWGAISREKDSGPSPSPYDTGLYGPVQAAGGQRIGAYPWVFNSAPEVAGRHWTFLSGFHMYFMARAMFAFQETCLAVELEKSWLDRVIRFYDDVHVGTRVHTSGVGGEAFPGYPVVTQGGDVQNDIPPTRDQVRAGVTYHALTNAQSNSIEGTSQVEKLGWVSAYLARRYPTQRDYYLQLLGEGYGPRVKGQTYAVAFENLYKGGSGAPAPATWLFQVTSSTNGNNIGCYGEHTWRMPWLAEVLNLFT